MELPFRRLSKGRLPPGNLGKINPKVASDLKKEKKIIENIQKEYKKINKYIGKLLNESKKNSWNIDKLEKITKDSLKELNKYIKLMGNLYGINLSRAYPEIIQLGKHMWNLYKIFEEIKKKGLSMNLGRGYLAILKEIYKLWNIHKHKISNT
jgi:hypothetical protein